MIADFVIDQMSRYIAGGMKPETAARFTRGELGAIYKGGHYSRDNSGAMRVTPPPENLDIETAMKKADAAIVEILKYREESAKKEAPETRNKPSVDEKKTGLEGLKNYVRKPA